ncbi:MAG: sulfotransferase [Planctomycetota bacterium]
MPAILRCAAQPPLSHEPLAYGPTHRSKGPPLTSISDKSARVPEFLPDTDAEAFIGRLNDALVLAGLGSPLPGTPERPMLFVSGGPRSGTTFCAQTLCRAFRLGWIDHLAARFWKAPAAGVALSRIVHGEWADRSTDRAFESGYGRTSDPSDIHGFHYFWMSELGLGEPATLFESPSERGITPFSIAAHLTEIERNAAAPMIFKGYYPSYFMKWFCDAFPTAVFVLIRRTPLDQARSIYRARLAYNGEPSSWWSMLPPEHESLQDLEPADQIAGQVLGLRRMFARQLSEDGTRCVVVDYEDLTKKPAMALERIGRSVTQLTGSVLPGTGVLPAVSDRSADRATEIDAELEAALERLADWDEPWPT